MDLEAEFENGMADVEMGYDSKLNADSIGFRMQYTMAGKHAVCRDERHSRYGNCIYRTVLSSICYFTVQVYPGLESF